MDRAYGRNYEIGLEKNILKNYINILKAITNYFLKNMKNANKPLISLNKIGKNMQPTPSNGLLKLYIIW